MKTLESFEKDDQKIRINFTEEKSENGNKK